jgi:hypothetical protein
MGSWHPGPPLPFSPNTVHQTGSNPLEEEAFWDVYYEHCSYFSAGSLTRLFRKAAFDVLQVGREYGDQYVTIEARPGEGTTGPIPMEDDLNNLKVLVERFATQVPGRITKTQA